MLKGLTGKYRETSWHGFLFISAVLVSLSVLHSSFSSFNKFALFSLIFLILIVHWDLRDGGLLTRLVFKLGGNFELRNWITLGAGYLFCTLILIFANGFHTPLISIYYIALVLTAIRGGVKFSAIYSLALAFSLGVFYCFTLPRDISFLESGLLLQPFLFALIGLISGFVAGGLRNLTLDLNALYEIGKSINSSFRTEDITHLILSVLFLDLEIDFGAIFLVDETDKKKFQLVAVRGDAGELKQGFKVETEEGIFSWVAKSRKTVRLPDLKRHAAVDIIKDKSIRSVVVTPMLVAEELVGVILVGKREPHAFNYQNIQFLEALTSQAALALENARLYTQTHQHAIRDGLTGIYNYRYFVEQLEEEISRSSRYGRPVSLIMVDVDFFKSINDTYGHLRGDEVLRDIARLLDSQTREIDMVARYGGEEFVVVLPETEYPEAFQVAIKLQEIVADTLFLNEKNKDPARVTISLGVSSYPSTALTRDELLKQADGLLYEAKAYRNAVCSIFEKRIAEPSKPGSFISEKAKTSEKAKRKK